MNIVLIGSTGLIGSHLLELYLSDDNVKKITVVTRKAITQTDSKVHNVIISDFSFLTDHQSSLVGEVFVSCLGTTLKDAGSKENFKKVDFDFNVQFANIAEKNKAQKYILVSSIGANNKSLNFYSRVKGQLEDHIKKLNIPQIHIIRPSLLLGHRKIKRFGEEIMQSLSPLLSLLCQGSLTKYSPISGLDVAKYMHHLSLQACKDEGNQLIISEYQEITSVS